MPRIVTGPTAGAAARFASTETWLTSPSVNASTGTVAICATSATAIARTNGAGSLATPGMRSSRCVMGAAASTSPAVAATDSANPMDTERSGSATMSTITPASSAGNACPRRPTTTASSPTMPVTSARSTDGSVPTTATNAASVTAATTTRPFGGAQANSHTAAPTIIATFAPDTAVRCASPEAVIMSWSAVPNPRSSPSVIAGTSRSGPIGSPEAASRRPSRTRVMWSSGCLTTSTVPRTAAVTPDSDGRSEADTEAYASNTVPRSWSSSRSSPKTLTRPGSPATVASAVAPWSVAFGVVVSVKRVRATASISSAMGCTAARARRISVPATATMVATAGSATVGSCRRHATAPMNTATTSSSHAHDVANVIAVVAHTTRADGTNRRSSPSGGIAGPASGGGGAFSASE